MAQNKKGTKSVRGIALAVLGRWQESEDHAETLIHHAVQRHELDSRDRGFLNALVLGVLRNGSLLDHWIDELREGKVDDDTQMILRLGLCQLLILNVDEHAAVNETVSLSKRARGFVNAILRRAVREREELLRGAEALPTHVRWSLPEFLVARWEKSFGKENARSLAARTNVPSAVLVRANRLVAVAEEAIAGIPGAEPVEGFDGFFKMESLPLDALHEGHCYAQDPSTSLAPMLLAPQPGESVLDACSAPGGKAAILAQQMENQGRLVCADSMPERLETTQENLERLKVGIAETKLVDWKNATIEEEKFDRILVDVPCSNTGVIGRRVDVRWRLEEDVFRRMHDLQLRILRNVVQCLKPGGVLVYSTCSIEREENEEVIANLIESSPGLTLNEEKRTLPHVDGVDGSYCAKLQLSN